MLLAIQSEPDAEKNHSSHMFCSTELVKQIRQKAERKAIKHNEQRKRKKSQCGPALLTQIPGHAGGGRERKKYLQSLAQYKFDLPGSKLNCTQLLRSMLDFLFPALCQQLTYKKTHCTGLNCLPIHSCPRL